MGSPRAFRTLWSMLCVMAVLPVLSLEVVADTAKSEPQNNKYNVLLISLDTLRADHLSCYGYPRNTSPNLDRFAKEGVLFENVTAASAITIPSHMSMFTGLYPSTHGVQGIVACPGEAVPTLAQVLSEHGYATAGFIASMLRPVWGFSRGFQVYDESVLVSMNARVARSAVTNDEITSVATDWLRQNGKEKTFFLFVHYWDCHSDYVPPPPYDRKFDPEYKGKVAMPEPEPKKPIPQRDLTHLVALYDGEIAHTDDSVRKLLKVLQDMKLSQNTLVIVTADHGEGFMEHGKFLHGNSLYEELVHVPLIMRLPNVLPQGLRVSGNVSHVDLMPTVLGLLGIPKPSTLQGADLSGVCRGDEEVPPDRIVFSEMESPGMSIRAVRWGAYKLIEEKGKAPIPLLLADGSSERDAAKTGVDADQCRQIQAQMHEALGVGPSIVTTPGYLPKSVEPSQETLQLLRSLGYLK